MDSDEGMVERARAKGLAVEQADAVAYLERQPEGSLGAVDAVHVIEHLRLRGTRSASSSSPADAL